MVRPPDAVITGPLVPLCTLIGLIGFVLTALIMLPAFTLIGFGSFMAAKTNPFIGAPVFGASTLLGFLIVLALVIPVNMALWFAPAVVMLQNQTAIVAITQSFKDEPAPRIDEGKPIPSALAQMPVHEKIDCVAIALGHRCPSLEVSGDAAGPSAQSCTSAL